MWAFFLPISKYLQGLHCFHNMQCMDFKQVEGQAQRCLWRGGRLLLGWPKPHWGQSQWGQG